MQGMMEGERAMEVILLGAYYKYSSTGMGNDTYFLN
jgi:hypothetical protein